jgi:hypothetical protein
MRNAAKVDAELREEFKLPPQLSSLTAEQSAEVKKSTAFEESLSAPRGRERSVRTGRDGESLSAPDLTRGWQVLETESHLAKIAYASKGKEVRSSPLITKPELLQPIR